MRLPYLIQRSLENPGSLPKKIFSLPQNESFHHTIARDINKLYHTRFGTREFNTDGIDIFEEDWDNLIILDACRHDYLEDTISDSQIKDNLEYRISRGSQTPEWLYANFSNQPLHDTVYITSVAMPYQIGVANPENPSHRQKKYGFDLDVHDLVDIWKNPPEGAKSPYRSKDLQSTIIPPDIMREAVLNVVPSYPEKCRIIHFGQPHDPYLGQSAEAVYENTAHPWRDKFLGKVEIPVSTLRKAYRENVEMAFENAYDLAQELDGKTVITADHGELLWERSSPIPIYDYLHPDETYIPELVKVPWLEIEGDRLNVTADPPRDYKGEPDDEEAARDQLSALGYIE